MSLIKLFSKAIFAKFIPCFLLVTFTSLLISSLIVINKNNKKLNSGYGAKSKLIKDSKSKSFIQKLYFFKKSTSGEQEYKRVPKVIAGWRPCVHKEQIRPSFVSLYLVSIRAEQSILVQCTYTEQSTNDYRLFPLSAENRVMVDS